MRMAKLYRCFFSRLADHGHADHIDDLRFATARMGIAFVLFISLHRGLTMFSLLLVCGTMCASRHRR